MLLYNIIVSANQPGTSHSYYTSNYNIIFIKIYNYYKWRDPSER